MLTFLPGQIVLANNISSWIMFQVCLVKMVGETLKLSVGNGLRCHSSEASLTSLVLLTKLSLDVSIILKEILFL